MKVYLIECKIWDQHMVVVAANRLQASGLAVSALYQTDVNDTRISDLLDQGWPRRQDISELDISARSVTLLE